MFKTCPYCRTLIDHTASHCPNCTQQVLGDPQSIEERLNSIRSMNYLDGCEGAIKVVVALAFLFMLGTPLLPVICLGGFLIASIFLALYAIRSMTTGGRHNG